MSDDGHLFRRALLRRTTQPEPEPRASSVETATSPRLVPLAAPTIDMSPFVDDDEPTSYRYVRPDVAPEVVRTTRRHALVVEDDEVLRDAVTAVLVDEGWGVVGAATLEDARAVLELLRPDVMVLDFNLQGEYASALVDEIIFRGRGVPTVLASASPLAIDASRTYGIELLMKPFELDGLVAVVERITRERVSAPMRRAG